MEKKETSRTLRSSVTHIAHQVAHSLDTEEVLWNNEIEANLLTEKILYLSAVILLTVPILNLVGIYHIAQVRQIWGLTIFGMVTLLCPAYLCHRCQGKNRWIKILMLISVVLVYGAADLILGYRATLLMAIPTVMAARYYDLRLVVAIEVLTTLVFGFSAAYGMYVGEIDLNYVTIAPGTIITVKDHLLNAVMETGVNYAALEESMILRFFLPKVLLYTVISVTSSGIARRGYRMVVNQAAISSEHARVETELNMASRIQERALPIVHTLPSHPSFDLSASMVPAKEVGGDFYDFFYLDPTHLGLMIADVSGKGVPAALFMMVSKLLLDNSITGGRSPGQALAEVNHQLCEKNMEEMFVTVWLGVLNLENGELVTANAGHEYPLICRKDGSFEVFKDRHGLVLGAMDGMRYPEEKILLEPGDALLVYTDGIPEAANAEMEQFGMDRMIAALNANESGSMDDLMEGLKKALNDFVGDAPQFDDTTVLAVRLNSLLECDGISGTPGKDSISAVSAYVEEQMQKANVPTKALNKVMIAVDEVYSNIVYYSGATWAQTLCRADDKSVTVTFSDNGVPYNLLEKEDPDIAHIGEGDTIGGLGIFMIRNLMSDVKYERKNGCNVVTIQLML